MSPPSHGIRSESRYFKVLPRRPAKEGQVETQHDRPSFTANESVRKSRPCWAAQTRLGKLGEYSLPPPRDESSPGGSGYSLKLHLPEILKTVFGPTPRKNPGYAPDSKKRPVSVTDIISVSRGFPLAGSSIIYQSKETKDHKNLYTCLSGSDAAQYTALTYIPIA